MARKTAVYDRLCKINDLTKPSVPSILKGSPITELRRFVLRPGLSLRLVPPRHEHYTVLFLGDSVILERQVLPWFLLTSFAFLVDRL